MSESRQSINSFSIADALALCVGGEGGGNLHRHKEITGEDDSLKFPSES